MNEEYEGLGLEDDEEQQTSAWMITYADIVTLLLTFFVLLFSMSSLDRTQFTDSFTAIKQALAGKSTELATAPISSREASVLVDQIQIRRQILEAQKKVFAEVKYLQSTKGMEGIVTSKLDEGKISLRVPSEVLFAPGSARLKPEGERIIGQLKNFFIKHADQTINIKGFTDNLPPGAGSRYRDNWELSAMRAVNVLRFLVSLGLSPDRMTATGLSDLNPIFPNNTPENRAKNRRVEFVLEKTVS